jgi:hypothetical protein
MGLSQILHLGNVDKEIQFSSGASIVNLCAVGHATESWPSKICLLLAVLNKFRLLLLFLLLF